MKNLLGEQLSPRTVVNSIYRFIDEHFIIKQGLVTLTLLSLTFMGTKILGAYGHSIASQWIQDLSNATATNVYLTVERKLDVSPYTTTLKNFGDKDLLQEYQDLDKQIELETYAKQKGLSVFAQHILVENVQRRRFKYELQIALNNLKGSEFNRKRLLEQVLEVKRRAKTHLRIMEWFYVYYYQSISVGIISTVIAGVSLFFISKKGWEEVNPYIVNIFLVSSSVTVLFGAFPLVFKIEENIKSNTTSYLAYVTLENRILSYIGTGNFITSYSTGNNLNLRESNSTQELSGNGKLSVLSEVIHYIDNEFGTLNKLNIGFDSTKVPNYRQLYPEQD